MHFLYLSQANLYFHKRYGCDEGERGLSDEDHLLHSVPPPPVKNNSSLLIGFDYKALLVRRLTLSFSLFGGSLSWWFGISFSKWSEQLLATVDGI